MYLVLIVYRDGSEAVRALTHGEYLVWNHEYLDGAYPEIHYTKVKYFTETAWAMATLRTQDDKGDNNAPLDPLIID